MSVAFWDTAQSGERARTAGYHPHADGLRAIAILAVIAFHAKIPGADFGFLGVDLFFVLSGFLILGRVLAQIERDEFFALEFLAKRALRILPLLFLVITSTLLIALFFRLPPGDWKELVQSARYGVFSLANIHFASKVGYFDTTAEAKPLLHLWSLSVEEQFYLGVAGAVALGVYLRSRTILSRIWLVWTAGIAFSLSAAWFVLGQHISGPEVFFSTLGRIWQFGLGGVAAFLVQRGITLPSLVGILGVVAVVLGLSGASDGISAAFVASVGASVLLSATAGPVASALSLPPLRALGKLSYGWYLWHWPILFFGRLFYLGETSVAQNVVLSGGALALACLSYLSLERPLEALRRGPFPRESKRWVFGGLLALALCIVGIGKAAQLASQPSAADPFWTNSKRPTLPVVSDHDGVVWGVTGPGEPRVVVYGDSHGEHLASALTALSKDVGKTVGLVFARGCAPVLHGQNKSDWEYRCERARAEAALRLGAPAVEGVIISGYWPLYMVKGPREMLSNGGDPLNEALSQLRSDVIAQVQLGRRVLLLSPVPLFSRSAPQCEFVSRGLPDRAKFCGATQVTDDRKSEVARDLLFKVAKGLPNVRIAETSNAFCKRNSCSPLIENATAYYDAGHLNMLGGRIVYEQIKSDLFWVSGQ